MPWQALQGFNPAAFTPVPPTPQEIQLWRMQHPRPEGAESYMPDNRMPDTQVVTDGAGHRYTTGKDENGQQYFAEQGFSDGYNHVFRPNAQGQWGISSQREGSGGAIKGMVDTVVQDKNLMAFLATAGAGALAAGATGSTAMAGLNTEGAVGTFGATGAGSGAVGATGAAGAAESAAGAASGATPGNMPGATDYGAPQNMVGGETGSGGLGGSAYTTQTNPLANSTTMNVPVTSSPSVLDAAAKAGMGVTEWVAANPGLAATLAGAVVGGLANSKVGGGGTPASGGLDPTAQAFRDNALSKIEAYSNSPIAQYNGGVKPAAATYGGANQPQALNGQPGGAAVGGGVVAGKAGSPALMLGQPVPPKAAGGALTPEQINHMWSSGQLIGAGGNLNPNGPTYAQAQAASQAAIAGLTHSPNDPRYKTAATAAPMGGIFAR